MGVISSSSSRRPVWTNQLKDSVWVWMRFGRGRTSGMWEKFSRRGASSNRLADSAKAIQDSSKRTWWGADTRTRSISERGAASTEALTFARVDVERGGPAADRPVSGWPAALVARQLSNL